jgi:hypothetical protein
MKSLKLIVVILSMILAVSYGFSLFLICRSGNLQQTSVRFFAFGFIPYTLAWLVILRRRYFFSTFEHELTHLIVGLIFFKKPVGFHATEGEGGSTVLYGGNFIITLAPYFLPTLVFFILPVYLILDPQFHKYYFILFGILTAYHFLSTWQEFSYRQPDIIKSGKIFSTVFLIFANIFCYGIIITFVLGGFELSGDYILNGLLKIKDLYLLIMSVI